MDMKADVESRFTAPRADCPHPERWHSTDADSTEIEVTALVASFVTALQPDYVIETGSAFGQTSIAIGRALQANGRGHLDTLEPDLRRAEMVEVATSGLPVRVLRIPSLEFVPAPKSVDFLWLDSLIELRADELRRYHEWCTDRTIVGFHDAGPHHAVKPRIQELVIERLIEPPLYLPTPRGVAFARVRK